MRNLVGRFAPLACVAAFVAAIFWVASLGVNVPAKKPAAAQQAGSQGTFTYTALDGSTVTVGREAPQE